VHAHSSFSVITTTNEKIPPSHVMRGGWGQGVGFRSVFVRSAFVPFVFVRSALVAFVSVRSALLVSVAPVTHPASSGSQTWWQVL